MVFISNVFCKFGIYWYFVKDDFVVYNYKYRDINKVDE